jgi:hypothetical protein
MKKKPSAKKQPAARPAQSEFYNLGNDWKKTWPLNEDLTPEELRACMLWEYARESRRLIELVDRVASGEASPDELLAVNRTFGRMVESAGKKADLRLPWVDLPKRLRNCMVKSLFTATSVAPYSKVEEACKKRELFIPGGFQLASMLLQGSKVNMGKKLVAGGLDGSTVVAFVVDASKPPALLAGEIEKLLAKHLEGPKGKGRGGRRGAETCRKWLNVLHVLRLASTRSNREVRRVGGSGIPPVIVRLYKLQAVRFFGLCFPHLQQFQREKMISVSWYERRPRDQRDR